MSSGSPIRTRSDHVASVDVRPGLFGRMLQQLQRGDTLLRLGLALVAAVVMFAVTRGWQPAFQYRAGYAPQRDVVVRVNFSVEDEQRTKEKQQLAARSVRCVYSNDATPLIQLRRALNGALKQVAAADTLEAVSEEHWQKLYIERIAVEGEEPSDAAAQFTALKAALAEYENLISIDGAIARALEDFERDGLIDAATLHPPEEGDQQVIEVHPESESQNRYSVRVDDVLIAQAEPRLRQQLDREMETAVKDEVHRETLLEHISHWFTEQLTPTLSPDVPATTANRDADIKAVQTEMRYYRARDPAIAGSVPGDLLAAAGEPLTDESLELLRREYDAMLDARTPAEILYRSLATFGMYVALYTLCGLYVFYRDRTVLEDLRRYCTLLGLLVATVCVAWICPDNWRIELIPVVVFALTIRTAHRPELALLLTATVALIVVLSLGMGVAQFVVLVATSTASVQMLGRIRSRTKLMYVGLAAAAVAGFTTLGVGIMVGQSLFSALLPAAGWAAFCTFMAAIIMTAVLPFVEALFDVQTELSLLELGDAAHPLLQELVRRAPGTYNHSINVASIGEAAAEAIGANGLLVRVGAYFHDIGKMLKPEYFVENQGTSGNRHDALLPAMSTLVIIAHVKDGADLARKHGLPNSIIDFILQHHGTTLVEYFYDQESRRAADDPEAGEVDENTFRYPGPRPQTKETAVMMLADAVESASRTLVDPTPARIESLVHDIAMKRLIDDQFDECGLTFSELRTVQDALVKNMIAVYHGRVKYPDQQDTA